MNKSLIISSSVVSIIVLAFAVYFFTHNNTNDLMGQRDQLQGNLTTAQNKLNKSKSTLDSMVGSLQSSFSLAVSVQDQMKRNSNIIKQTDFMFNDPYGSNPSLIFTNPLSNLLINDQRKDVNKLLAEWQKEMDLLSLKKIDLAESQKIRKNAEIMKKYIESLSQIVGSLTEENSGLTQYQIDNYLSHLPSIASINGVLAALDTAIEISQNTNVSVSAGAGSGAGSSGTGQSSPTTPTVTPEEVAAQQAEVAAQQAQVETILEQIRQIDQQVEEEASTPTPTPTPNSPAPVYNPYTTEVPPTPSPEVIDPAIVPELTTEPPASSPEPASFVLPPREHILIQGIIIQPGPPRLIQGTDPY